MKLDASFSEMLARWGEELTLLSPSGEGLKVRGLFEFSFYDRTYSERRRLRTEMLRIYVSEDQGKTLNVDWRVVFREKEYRISTVDRDFSGVTRIELVEEYRSDGTKKDSGEGLF
jgi:hypothetical protein